MNVQFEIKFRNRSGRITVRIPKKYSVSRKYTPIEIKLIIFHPPTTMILL